MVTINQASASTGAESMLIATKVRVPHTGAVVPRPRLMERLAAALARPLTLVAAPAGSGKTTLLAAWAAATPRTVAWVSLDADDNDPARFLSCVAAAFDASAPGTGEQVRRLLTATYPAGPAAVMAALANEVDARGGQWALVLDDYHLIEEAAIHEGIAYLVTHLPPNLRMILSCRGDPPLPLASLRARNQLSELRVADLRFSVEEAAALLASLTGAPLPEAEIIALTERLEGWVAGLVLAGLALHGRTGSAPSAAVLSGEHRYIVDYFVDEILLRVDPAVERFLLRTSILNRLTAPLCDALLDETGSQAMLERLERANLFVFALDDERRWFRYHHLFAGVLRHRLARREPERLPDLHRRAAEWHLAHGDDVAVAIHHLLAIPDPERAAMVIERHAPALLACGEVRTLRDWVEALPEATVLDRPWLCLRHAWALAHAGLPDTAETRLRNVETWLATAGGSPDTPLLLGELVTLRSRVAVIRNEPERTVELAHQALAILPAHDAPNRAAIGLNLGGAYSAIGDLDAAGRAYAEVIALGPAAGPLAAALALRYRADLEVVRGRLHSAARLYGEAADFVLAQGAGDLPAKGIICEGLADLAYQRNDLDAAEEQAREAIARGDRGGEAVKISVPALITLAKVRQARGDSEGALETIERAVLLGYGPGPAAWRARLWLRQGDLRAASAWARASGLDPASIVDVRSEIELATLARVLVAEGSPEEAAQLAARLLDLAERLGRAGRAIEFLIVLALAQQASGEADQAVAMLARALTLACDEGFIRVFADEGPPLAPILSRARGRLRRGDGRERRASAFANTILAAIAAETAEGPAENRPPLAVLLVEPLTEREREVLRLLAAGQTNQEIADALYVTVGTVKTHTHRIYAKLGVRGRTEAIARGREAGLLP